MPDMKDVFKTKKKIDTSRLEAELKTMADDILNDVKKLAEKTDQNIEGYLDYSLGSFDQFAEDYLTNVFDEMLKLFKEITGRDPGDT